MIDYDQGVHARAFIEKLNKLFMVPFKALALDTVNKRYVLNID